MICKSLKRQLYDEKRTPTTEKVRLSIESKGYHLTNKDFAYVDAKFPIDLLCPKGHQYSTCWNYWQRGCRCSHIECEGMRISESKRDDFGEVKKFIEQKGYKVKTDYYKNARHKLHLICSEGHDCHISWNKFRGSSKNNLEDGVRCRICSLLKSANSRRIDLKTIRQLVEAENYKVVLPFSRQNSKDIFTLQCSKDHEFDTCWNYWQRGHRCPVCFPAQSKSEKEIIHLYENLGLIERDRFILKPKELDIYFPTQKVAIEYCGLYWHSDALKRITPKYHRDKLDKCNKQDIHLLTIFDDEWLNHKDICISRINSALGIVQNKIFARKCLARQILNKEAREFLARTHLQGAGSCKIAYGLFYNNKLVQVMTFGSPARAHTAKGRRVLEMKRLAGELNTIIVGGASKLFKLGLQYAKDNNYEIVKSYCDLRWGTGNLYAKLGFTKTYETEYTPHYTDGIKRFRNQILAQNKQKTGVTEEEIANKKGLYKIYDCGHQTWEYNIV